MGAAHRAAGLDGRRRGVREGEGAATTWTVRLGERRVTFVAEITEVVHGRRIAWRSLTGPAHEGSVAFVSLDEAGCAVVVDARGDAGGGPEHSLEMLGLVRRRVREALAGFKGVAETAHRTAPAPGAVREDGGGTWEPRSRTPTPRLDPLRALQYE